MDAHRVPVAEADLPSLIQRVAAGEQVVLTQDGHDVIELHAPVARQHRSPAARDAWRRLVELRDRLPPLAYGTSSVDLINVLREEREEAIWPSTSTRAPSSL